MILVAGCPENSVPTSGASKSGSSLGSSGTAGGSSASATETQCLMFKANAKDYSTCRGCKNSLCSCKSATCTEAELGACSVNLTSLIQCVHDNLNAASAGCTAGLKCGDNQVADFSSCVCRDATPPTSIGSPPGQEDTTSPYVEPGFYVNNRFCPASDITSSPLDCMASSGKTSLNIATTSGVLPKYSPQSAVNVIQDVGYLRWDLALDASQYPPGIPMSNNLPFLGSNATVPMTVSMYYQLKPKTQLYSSTAKWNDCVEHFSGYVIGATGFASSEHFCEPRAGTNEAPAPLSTTLTQNSTNTGTASWPNISMNGSGANYNLFNMSDTGNPALETTNRGIAKYVTGAAALNASGQFNTPTLSDKGVGLLSNIGFYKYSWGPVTIQKTTDSSTAASITNGRIAINTNLGYTPGSSVQSTAMSPLSVTNTVSTRNCNDSTVNPNPCVTTTVYRSSGGAVLTQSFSPTFSSNHHASSVGILPSGVTAVSTPKIIEDIVQDTTTAISPARLRVFVKGADGNIHMSRYENGQWNSWMSLGRPWICGDLTPANGASTQTKPCNSLITNQAPIYGPLSKTSLPAVTAWTTTPDPNDGISLAGEPVVTSFYTSDGGSPARYIGYVGIFVRVSHLNSSTGKAGAFHNAIFYTFSAISSAYVTGTTRAFDNPSNWSPWMPVKDAAGHLFRIQGNPTVFISKNDTDTLTRFYIFGTTLEKDGTIATDGSAANLQLHPPIGPDFSVSNANGFRGANNSAGNTVGGYWFNYGNAMVRSSLNISAYLNANWTYPPAIPNWGTITASQPGTANSVIVSDWTWAPVDTSATAFTKIRIFANQILHKKCDVGGYPSADALFSPCLYDQRAVAWKEYVLDAAGHASGLADTGNAVEGCGNTTYSNYNGLSFVGNINPINLSGYSSLTPTQATSASVVPSAYRMFLFGRAYCASKTYCDPVNPSAAYAVVNHLTHCNNALRYWDMMYSGYKLRDSVQGAPLEDSSVQKIQPFLVTSDVVPTYSMGLHKDGTDVPIYFITRDPNGKISNGVWMGKDGGGKGTPQFQIKPTGAFTN